MAKKKSENAVQGIEQAILKEFGDDILVSGSYIADQKKVIIPVSPAMDMMLGGGIPEGSFVIPTGPPKVGKMQSMDSKVYTPFGCTKIGSLRLGDVVCTPSGISTVNGIFDHLDKELFTVEFDDGSKTVCGMEHLWKAKTRFTEYKTISLEDIYKRGLTESDGRCKWHIPLGVASFLERGIDIDPYLLGVLIGHGCITKNISLTSNDAEIIDDCNKVLENGFYFKKLSTSNIEYFLCTNNQKNIYKSMLKKYGLYGKTSHGKFIPLDYLYNTEKIRWSLLQGLIDTDGTVTDKGNPSYTTVSKQLALDIKQLVNSLGGLCKISQRYTSYNKKKKFISYRLNIRFNNYDKCCRIERKRKLLKNRTKKTLNRKIKNIKFKEISNARCISIFDKNSLYLTDDFIVTHNTSFSFDFAATALNYPCDLCEQRDIYFFNIEGRVQARDLLGINHLIPHIGDRLHVIRSKPGKILTGEDYIDIGERLINEKPGCIFIFDSFSQLCTKARKDADIGDRFRDDTPLLLSNFCKRICNVIPVNKSIVIGITHLIANQGRGMSMWSEASGRKVQYQVDVKIKATHDTPWRATKADDSPQIGQDVNWECYASPIGPKGTKCISKLRYGWGLDKHAELINIATDLNIVKKAGSWYRIGDHKAQGLESFRNLLVAADEDLFKNTYSQVREMLGYESL